MLLEGGCWVLHSFFFFLSCLLGCYLIVDQRLGRWKPLLATGKFRDSWISWCICILQKVGSVSVALCYFLRCAQSLGKKFALKVLKLSWFPVDYLCPDIVSLCRCIYCRMKWHNSCFIGNKIMEKSRKEFNT